MRTDPPRTLFHKIWDRHVVLRRDDYCLLYVDRHIIHDGSFHAFTQLEKEGRRVRKPRQTFATADHYLPTLGRERTTNPATQARELSSSSAATPVLPMCGAVMTTIWRQ